MRGIRPPAVREEKSPLWDFKGVDTATDAIVSNCLEYDDYCVSRRETVNSDEEQPNVSGEYYMSK